MVRTPARGGASVRSKPRLGSHTLAGWSTGRLLWLAVGIGTLLRLAQYLANPSLTADESFLVLNIEHTSLADLLGVLNNNQAAPAAFLALEHLAARLLGTSEYALRLLPLMCGVASLVVFVKVAAYFLERGTLVLAAALFALLTPLILYSAQVKQYSSDTLAALLAYAAGLLLAAREPTVRRSAALAVIGSALVWLSHPVAFVLAAVGIGLGVTSLARRDARRLRHVGAVSSAWLLSFAISYLAFGGNVQDLQRSYVGAILPNEPLPRFMPFPPRSLGDLKWFPLKSVEVFVDSLGFQPSLAGVGALLFLVGCASFLAQRRRLDLFLLLAPVALALLASGLQKYPFGGRFVLFAVPGLVMVVAAGIRLLLERARGFPAVRALVVGFALLPFVGTAAQGVVEPEPLRQDIRPVIEYIAANYRQGDGLYVDRLAQFPFRFYAERMEAPWPVRPAPGGTEQYAPTLESAPPAIVVGESTSDDVPGLAAEIDALRPSGRAWLLFLDGQGEGLSHHLDVTEEGLDRFDAKDATAYLYALRPLRP